MTIILPRYVVTVLILIWFQQTQVEVLHSEELLQSFKEQAAQSATKVCTRAWLPWTNTNNLDLELRNSIITISLHHPWLVFVHQVCELQSSLSACRAELNLCLQQMEEVQKNYESELQKKNDKVQPSTQLYTLLSLMPLSLLLFMQSPLLRLISSSVPTSSGVLPAGEALQCQPGLPELQRAEPAAAAFTPAAADNADREHCSHLWTGGESEPAADTGE